MAIAIDNTADRPPAGQARRAALAMVLYGIMAASPASADVNRGREVAAAHCTRCHVVGDINPYGGIESTPSFIGMKYLADWERRFEEFYILPPHPALVRISEVSAERSEERPAFVHEIVLTLEDVDAILAFVRTLPSPAR
jgi:mono/diheme cytochrome c family protein